MTRGKYIRTTENKKLQKEKHLGRIGYWKGKKLSKEHKDKISKTLTGVKQPKEVCEKKSQSHIGLKHSIETRKKMSNTHKGFYEGLSADTRNLRKTLEYRLWREAVLIRDDYTCQICGDKDVKLNADHIKPFKVYPELGLDISNGRTLCEVCHRKTPTYGFNLTKWIKQNQYEQPI